MNAVINQHNKTLTDRSREWLDIEGAPHGVKLHLLTKEGMPTHGAISESNKHLFKGYESLPNTPQWMKEVR